MFICHDGNLSPITSLFQVTTALMAHSLLHSSGVYRARITRPLEGSPQVIVSPAQEVSTVRALVTRPHRGAALQDGTVLAVLIYATPRSMEGDASQGSTAR